MAVVRLETVMMVARFFTDGNAPVGSPFDFQAFIIGDERTAIVKALHTSADKPLTSAHRVALADALRDAGFDTMQWWRHSNDGTEKKLITVRLNRDTAEIRQR